MARRKKGRPEVICDYCKHPAELILDSTRLYGRDFGPAWVCWPCGAWVGTHRSSKRHAPLGRLANAALRKAKQAAHRAFDPLWKAKVRRGAKQSEARDAAYEWLAGQLGIDRKHCHIGQFNVAQCMKVVEVCAPYQAKARAA